MGSNSVDVVLQFEQVINSHNPGAVVALLTPDSVFVDSLGSRVQGVEKLRAAWEGYFKMVPDYSISHDEIFEHGNTIAMFGSARGTFSQDGQLRKENFWTTPAAWRAVVRDGKIASWQVFTDNEPIRAIMRRPPGKD
ncbi:MAG: nuclear transport factor 2 family protein [Candidatus Sulfotelmatobacter sp.]